MNPQTRKHTQRVGLYSTTKLNMFRKAAQIEVPDTTSGCIHKFIRDTEAHPDKNFWDHPFYRFVEAVVDRLPNESGAAMGRRAAEIATDTPTMACRNVCYKCKQDIENHPHPFDAIIRCDEPTWAGLYVGYDIYHNDTRATVEKILADGVVLTNGIVVREPTSIRLVCDTFHPEITTPSVETHPHYAKVYDRLRDAFLRLTNRTFQALSGGIDNGAKTQMGAKRRKLSKQEEDATLVCDLFVGAIYNDVDSEGTLGEKECNHLMDCGFKVSEAKKIKGAPRRILQICEKHNAVHSALINLTQCRFPNSGCSHYTQDALTGNLYTETLLLWKSLQLHPLRGRTSTSGVHWDMENGEFYVESKDPRLKASCTALMNYVHMLQQNLPTRRLKERLWVAEAKLAEARDNLSPTAAMMDIPAAVLC